MSDKITYRITCKIWSESGDDHKYGAGEGDTIDDAVRQVAISLETRALEHELERRRYLPAITAVEEWLNS